MKTTLPIVMFLFFSFLLKAEIPILEKNALLSIKASANVNNNWSNEVPVDQWTGVTVSEINEVDHVTGLYLSVSANGDNYTITLSNEVSNLQYLESFNMNVFFSSNDNIGVIVDFASFAGLESLTELEVSLPNQSQSNVYNILNLESIGQLVQLKKLLLKFESESLSLPSTLSNLINLTYLEYRNDKGDFPNYIYNLQNLEELILEVRIHYFPSHVEDLPNLINLKKIRIVQNYGNFYDSVLPASFYQLPSIEHFSISSDTPIIISNDISNYSDRLKYLSVGGDDVYLGTATWYLENLESLVIRNDYYSYSVSPLIENLSNLKDLKVSSFYSIQLPTTIKNLYNLEYLLLHPQDVSNYTSETYEIPNLKTFVANYYNNIPEAIGNLTNLEHLQIVNYGELASLPESIGNLSNLKKLDLLGNSENYLTFPETYFNWPMMEQFWTWYNVDYDFTNKFQNMPNLDILALEISNKASQNARGILNLCNNQNLRVLTLHNSNITEVDLRNNQRLADNSFGYSILTNNNIGKFIVDDVTPFYNLVDLNRIRITDNPNYEVLTSNEPCIRTMQTTDLISKSPNFYPNPAKDYLTFVDQERVENVEIYSIDGKKYEVDYYSNKIDVRNLPTGVYMIKWMSNGMYKIDKFIKK